MTKQFPDLNKDGEITKADILRGRGVFKKGGSSKFIQKAIKKPGKLGQRARFAITLGKLRKK